MDPGLGFTPLETGTAVIIAVAPVAALGITLTTPAALTEAMAVLLDLNLSAAADKTLVVPSLYVPVTVSC